MADVLAHDVHEPAPVQALEGNLVHPQDDYRAPVSRLVLLDCVDRHAGYLTLAVNRSIRYLNYYDQLPILSPVPGGHNQSYACYVVRGFECELSMARILIIDDDVSIARMLADFLESCGHTVAVAHDGARGIQYVDLRRPDAIVLDLMLPGITGVEVAKRLRLDPDTRDIPILTVTGVEAPDDLAEILMVDAVVSKPFSLETILSELTRMLESQPTEDSDDSAASAARAQSAE